ncbi:peptidoglycan binding domain protein [Pseudooceanicola batsensis HTCC2597]|uniref:Peptidoglycan binding domain protein n=1 Tax=Pseudooceanicola batsensis (strain ATCC BAA-863 / DSM 15984 / KCTC 12145 / HTCC2597) TaxID=252305 RepID=A3TTN8_PSEBH|nr:trypsin-like peptidase domain-containing protein [Pseudooceanicola batsensis]EAQ05015.1 peptidoglycan binding domain protein [Pseudooceanicola batsensis HTCC2597]
MFRHFLRLASALIVALHVQAVSVRAQSDDLVWVQIEAQPSIALAEDAIRGYADRLQDVNGFALGGGWYGIALGPYTREDATRVLQVLRAEGAIPRDSYIAFSSAFRQQFWPRGANSLDQAAAAAPQATDDAAPADAAPADRASEQVAETRPEPAPAPEPEPVPDETPAEARRSEALLSRDERMELQVALKWAGYYNSAIDGAFGRGTRGSMAAWQENNGYDRTGVLTTRQRAALMRQYNAVLEGLDLRRVTDDTAGIRMLIPTGVVAFDRYEAPFAHYNPTGDIDARVILISQQGDQKTLFGLYDILQTLAIVPEDGPRERRSDGFTIVGENARIVSHTEVTLRDGRIKGWTLVWPSGDEERRSRLLGEMQKSFERIEGVVMPSAMGADESQSIDLLSGLEIRKPVLSRSGFYVNDRGYALTVAEAVGSCGRITLDNKVDAEVVARDDTAGVALLKPTEGIAPLGYARFSTAIPRLQSEVAVAGYPYEGRLAAPTLNFGKVEELQGLAGEDWIERLSLSALPGDAGGPVIDESGAVIGMLMPAGKAGRQLPPEVSFAVDGQVLVGVLGEAGLSAVAADTDRAMAPEDITRVGMAMTALVSCWE